MTIITVKPLFFIFLNFFYFFQTELLSWAQQVTRVRNAEQLCMLCGYHWWSQAACRMHLGREAQIVMYAMDTWAFRHRPLLSIQNCCLLCTTFLQCGQGIYFMQTSANRNSEIFYDNLTGQISKEYVLKTEQTISFPD